MAEATKQPAGVNSLFPVFGFQGSDSSRKSWWQAPFPVEPPCYPPRVFSSFMHQGLPSPPCGSLDLLVENNFQEVGRLKDRSFPKELCAGRLIRLDPELPGWACSRGSQALPFRRCIYSRPLSIRHLCAFLGFELRHPGVCVSCTPLSPSIDIKLENILTLIAPDFLPWPCLKKADVAMHHLCSLKNL